MRTHDRSRKVNKRKQRMVVHGIAMKRLLVERAAHAQAPPAVAASARPTDAITDARSSRASVSAACERS